MGLLCFRQVSDCFGHVSVSWNKPRVQQPGARWAWPSPPAPAVPSLLWASGGRRLSKRPRERPSSGSAGAGSRGGCGRGRLAARLCCCPGQAEQPSPLASQPAGPWPPHAREHSWRAPERLPAMFNLSRACCVLLRFGSHVESSHLA